MPSRGIRGFETGLRPSSTDGTHEIVNPNTGAITTVAVAAEPPEWLTKIAPAWNGLWLAGQALFISYGLLTLMVVVALVSSGSGADAPGWARAAGFASRLWLLGHGGVAAFVDMPVTLLPLGLALCNILLFRACARRSSLKYIGIDNPKKIRQLPQFATIFTSITIYAFITMFISSSLGQHVADNLRAGLGAVIICGIAFIWAFASDIRRRLSALEWPFVSKLIFWNSRAFAGKEIWYSWLRRALSVGVIGATIALFGAILLGALLVAAWAWLGRDATMTVVTALSPGLVGSVILGFGQLVFLPNWVIWATAWIAGPGFSIGAGTSYAPSAIVGGPLPALPLMAALPPSNWVGSWALWSPILFLALGALVGAVLWRRLDEQLPELLCGAFTAAVLSALGMAFLQHLAAGGVGAGRLEMMGAHAWIVAGIFGAEILVGALTVVGAQFAGVKSAARKISPVG